MISPCLAILLVKSGIRRLKKPNLYIDILIYYELIKRKSSLQTF